MERGGEGRKVNLFYSEFCASRVEGLEGKEEGKVWRFIGASFSQDPATEYLQLLGFNLQEVSYFLFCLKMYILANIFNEIVEFQNLYLEQRRLLKKNLNEQISFFNTKDFIIYKFICKMYK